MATRVLIVDDSALIRQLLTEILSADPAIEVVGSAPDPYVAWEKIKQLSPDLITLDVEMPRMDGLSFLQRLIQLRPMPVLMVSSLTEAGCATTLRALELGAVDFVTKPRLDVRTGTVELAEELYAKVKAAAHAHVNRPARRATSPTPSVATSAMLRSTEVVIALGASTGGTEALREVLAALPANAPGILVVQHMPERFTTSFAERLDSLCRVRVREAADGDRVLPGHVLLAPGNWQMELTRSGATYQVSVQQTPPVNRHRPSVDVLFDSCARFAGSNAVGALLTGMGADGARGLLAMRRAGARTLAQDEATSVVFGMPKEAIQLGAAEEVLPLPSIAEAILRLASRR
ncbi:MAG: chemotaxis response regulator protein-glutamate methylesterase [Candidatus Eisenbacteria bacterium]